MMVMIVMLRDEFEAGCSIAEIKTLDHAHLLQQMHRAVNGGEIAFTFRKRGEDFFDSDRVLAMAKDFQDRLAGAGNFSCFAAELLREVGEVLAALMVRMRTLFHATLPKRRRLNAREMMKSAMQLRTIAGPQGTLSFDEAIVPPRPPMIPTATLSKICWRRLRLIFRAA